MNTPKVDAGSWYSSTCDVRTSINPSQSGMTAQVACYDNVTSGLSSLLVCLEHTQTLMDCSICGLKSMTDKLNKLSQNAK